MIAKRNSSAVTEEHRGRVKVGKLRLNKETVKDLTADDLKKVDGGLVVITIIGILIGPLLPAVGTDNCHPTKK